MVLRRAVRVRNKSAVDDLEGKMLQAQSGIERALEIKAPRIEGLEW